MCVCVCLHVFVVTVVAALQVCMLYLGVRLYDVSVQVGDEGNVLCFQRVLFALFFFDS